MPHDIPHFWRRRTLLSYLLLPIAALFALITACRRALYRCGILRAITDADREQYAAWNIRAE